jgi:hypothetical protein
VVNRSITTSWRSPAARMKGKDAAAKKMIPRRGEWRNGFSHP